MSWGVFLRGITPIAAPVGAEPPRKGNPLRKGLCSDGLLLAQKAILLWGITALLQIGTEEKRGQSLKKTDFGPITVMSTLINIDLLK